MIRFVYFDLGGVAIKDFSDSNKWKELQWSLGVSPENEEKFLTIWKRHHDRECIDYDVDKTISELKEELNLVIPDEYSLLNGFIERFEQNKSIWPILAMVKKRSRIGLLTNAYPRMLDAIKKKRILPPVEWDVEIDSSIVKLKKPDEQIFKLATEKANCFEDEILFIDNQEKHVNAAKQFGWKSYLYSSIDYLKSSGDLQEFLLSGGLI